MLHEFIINGVRLDLEANFSLEIQVVNNLLDFNNLIQADNSKFFTVVATDAINKALKHANRLAISAEMYSVDAIYRYSGHQFFTGKLVIDESTEKIYKILFVSNGLTVDLSEKNLRDIDWTALDIPRNEFTYGLLQNPNTVNSDNSNYCLPMFKSTSLYSSNDFNFMNTTIFNKWSIVSASYQNTIFVPWIFIKNALSYFLLQNGYQLGGTFFDTALGKKLNYPTNYLVDLANLQPGVFQSDINTPGPLTNGTSAMVVVFEREIQDTFNAYDPQTGIYKIKSAGIHNISYSNVFFDIDYIGPTLGSNTYQITIDALVKGVVYTLANQSGTLGFGNPDRASVNINTNFSVTATADDIDEEIKMILTFTSGQNRIQVNWTEGAFNVDVTPDREISPTIPFKELVPNQTFADFLATLQAVFPLQVMLNPRQKTLNIFLAKEVEESALPITDWSAYAGETYLKKSLENKDGFTLNYNYDESEIKKLVDFKSLNYRGSIATPTQRLALNPTSPNDYLYCNLNNGIYKAEAQDEQGNLRYQFYAYHIYPQIVGNGLTQINPDTKPVEVDYDLLKATLPTIKFNGNSEFLKEGSSDFELQLAFWHGMQAGYDIDQSIAAQGNYPYASPSFLNHFGEEIFNTSLNYQDPDKSIYLDHYKVFLAALSFARPIERNFLLPITELLNLDVRRKIVVDFVQYTLKELNYSLGETDISPATAILLKAEPKALALAFPNEFKNDFNCSIQIDKNTTPGEIVSLTVEDSLNVRYTLQNLSETLTISGIATIQLYYIDPQGNEDLLGEVSEYKTLDPLETETLIVEFTLRNAYFQYIYEGRIKLKYRFGNRCAGEKTYIYMQTPPNIEGTFVYQLREDVIDTGKRTWRFGGTSRYADDSPLSNWLHKFQFKVAGELYAEYHFSANNLGNNPIVVFEKNNVNYRPYFFFIIDPNFCRVDFFKEDFAFANLFYIDAFPNNVDRINNLKTYTLCMNYTTSVQQSGFICSNCPSDLVFIERGSSLLAIGPNGSSIKVASKGFIIDKDNSTNQRTAHIYCHDGLIFSNYIAGGTFVCSNTNSDILNYTHNPDGDLPIVLSRNYYGKNKVQSQKGINTIKIQPFTEQTNGYLAGLSSIQTDVIFLFETQQIAFVYTAFASEANAAGGFAGYNNFSALRYRILRNTTVNDINGNSLTNFYSLTGGNVIQDQTVPGSFTGPQYDIALTANIIDEGKYSFDIRLSANARASATLDEIILYKI